MTEFLIPLLMISQAVAGVSTPIEKALCPAPSVIVKSTEGRIYSCERRNGKIVPVDVTPPDDEAHWRLGFGLSAKRPNGTGSYHPVQDWPFRSLYATHTLFLNSKEYFYIFDRSGQITQSSEADAVGQRMMEIRISGLRIWPTANVYYRLPVSDKRRDHLILETGDISIGTMKYAVVVDGRMLCPVLDENGYSEWKDDDGYRSIGSLHINGHCKDARKHETSPFQPDQETQVWYTYPGFPDGQQPFEWSFQRHDEPEHPIRNKQGDCLALCRPVRNVLEADGHERAMQNIPVRSSQ